MNTDDRLPQETPDGETALQNVSIEAEVRAIRRTAMQDQEVENEDQTTPFLARGRDREVDSLPPLTGIPVDEVSLYFSPNGGCQAILVKLLDNAKQTIRVQEYVLTNKVIAQALISAHTRKVDVQVILDAGESLERYSQSHRLADAGIPVYIDDKHAIAHNKIALVDGIYTATGSYNITGAAETNNAENLLILKSRSLHDQYLKNWERHKSHSLYFPKEVS
jgi:phosphatidylserine/phosphatidylglycerophosphate/cardiolipin synthase-like enzyme